MRYFNATPALALGAFFGVLLIVALRVQYFSAMAYIPNMDPRIAYYFSPFLLLVVLGIGLPLELIFRMWHTPSTLLQAGLVGFSYASVLTW